MKKNKPKYLKLYEEWMEKGEMPTMGLCEYFIDIDGGLSVFREFKFMHPTADDLTDIALNKKSQLYWGSDGENFRWSIREFTPLRQNLVLLMAALNNEL